MPISLWHIILAVRHSPQMPTWMCARMLITPPPQCDKGMRPLPHLSTLFCEVGLLPELSVSGLSKAANRRLLVNRSFHLVAVPLNKESCACNAGWEKGHGRAMQGKAPRLSI